MQNTINHCLMMEILVGLRITRENRQQLLDVSIKELLIDNGKSNFIDLFAGCGGLSEGFYKRVSVV